MNGKNRYDNLIINLSNANYRDNGTDRYRNIFNTGASEHGAFRFATGLSVAGENGLLINTDDIGLVLLSADISYVITNTSTSTMIFGANAVTITDEVNVTANVTSQPISIAPGQSTGFTINVTPTTSGVLSFTVNIATSNVLTFNVVGQGNVAVVTFEYSSDGNTFFDLDQDDVIDLADNINNGTLTIRVNSTDGQSTVENISTSSGDLVEDDSPPITVSADSFEDLTFTPTSVEQNDYSVVVQLTINGQSYDFTFSFDIYPTLLVEYSTNGVDWTEAAASVTAGNLSGESFSLRLTSSIDTSVLTNTSTVPQVLDPDDTPVFNLTAGVPEILTYTPRDPGITDLDLDFNDFDPINIEVTCYVLDGLIRTVNTAGTTTGLTSVCNALLSAGDISAAVGYTTMELARAACSAGDWIVGLEDAEFARPTNAITVSTRITCDDAVRPTLGRYGDGFRISDGTNAALLSVSNGAVAVEIFVHDIGLQTTANGSLIFTTAGAISASADVYIERNRVRKAGSGSAVRSADADVSVLVANNYIECENGIGVENAVAASGHPLGVVCYNNTVVATGAALRGIDGTGGSSVGAQGNYVGVTSTGSFAFNVYDTVTAIGNGSNGSSNTSAPGTTTYHNLAMGTYCVSATNATRDLAVLSRAALEARPCEDNSAISARDVDLAVRDFWGIGAKWITA